MEQTSCKAPEAGNSHSCPDLNFDNRVEGIDQSLLHVDIDGEFASLSIDEMEIQLKVNQPMQNELVAYGLYCVYARAKGFSVRKGNLYWFRDGSGIKARDFLCSCEGNKDEKNSKHNIPAYIRPTFRCDCKAKLRVGRLKGQNWRVTVFNTSHSHDMYPPDQTYLLRSGRQVNSESEKCFESMVKCGISVARAYEFLQTSSRGRENVGYTQKDVYNCLSRSKKLSILENGDADQLVHHFMEMTNREPYFYYNVEKDKDNRLVNLFFRDYRCSVDYEHFGDVLSFDSTYRTNKYNMICCPFVGINHHLQSVMFGFAFLSDETQDSFEWLFRTFLESMGGKQPETIFTDQCRAMMNAIERVFPTSHHRLCQWHINQNAPSHLGSLNGDSKFKSLWQKCMTGCNDEEEFELTWKQMEDEYKISKHKWLNIMYGLRHKWATAFSCHRFNAGLKATSRSEGANSALKKIFGGATSSLYDCVTGFEKIQATWRMNEKEKDTRSHHGRLPSGENSWVIQAAKIYTMKIFTLFQQEVVKSVNFAIIDQQEVVGSSQILFTMKSRGGSSRIRTVQFDKLNTSASCNCHKFETFGILCCHVLKVFDRVNLDYIPEKYIKKRWTKNVKNRVCDVRAVAFDNPENGSNMMFLHEMMRLTFDLATRAQFRKETRCILAKAFRKICLELNDWFENFQEDVLAAPEDLNLNEDNIQATNTFLRDPQRVKSRGITDVHARHWDVRDKRVKSRGENSKRPTKGTKRGRESTPKANDECPSQTWQAASMPQPSQPSYPLSFAHGQIATQPLQYHAYPFRVPPNVFNSGETRSIHFDNHPFQMVPSTSQLSTNHFPSMHFDGHPFQLAPGTSQLSTNQFSSIHSDGHPFEVAPYTSHLYANQPPLRNIMSFPAKNPEDFQIE